MTAEYRYLAYDLRTNVPLEEIPLQDISFSWKLNGVGGFTARMPLGVSTTTSSVHLAATEPAKTAIYVERDGVIVWGGILWGRTRVKGERAATLAGEDFFSYFNRRVIREKLGPYTSIEQFQIAENIVDYVQGATGGDLLVNVHRTPTNSGVQRDRTYESWDRKNAGEAISQLAAVDDGFDFMMTSAYSAGVPTRTLEFSYPRRGRTVADTGLIFETSKSLTGYTWAEDGSRMANAVDAIGAGDTESMLIVTAYETSGIDVGYPLLDAVVSFKDVVLVGTLGAHARAEVVARQLPVTTPNLTVIAGIEPELGEWIVGDDVRIRVQDSDLFPNGLDTIRRIVAAEVRPDSSDGETVTLTFFDTPTE